MRAHPDQLDTPLKQYLRAYEVEPLGKLLVDRLHLPAPVIGAIFAILYFGVLSILHGIAGTRSPSSFRELFQHPSTVFYYPNLLGITFDLAGNPLAFAFLGFIRHFVPSQFGVLAQDNVLVKHDLRSSTARRLHKIASGKGFQLAAVVLLPAFLGVWYGIQFGVYRQPAHLADQYAVLLGMLAVYAVWTVIVQLAYIFVILHAYSLNLQLKPICGDLGSMLRPLGNMAVAIYAFLFLWAMLRSVILSVEGGPFAANPRNISALLSFLYLWLVFPASILVVFEQLVYRPHRLLANIRRQYLQESSAAWMTWHRQIHGELLDLARTGKQAWQSGNFDDKIKLLEDWAKLDSYIAEMNTWPLPRSAFRAIAFFVNPLVPLFIPLFAGLLQGLFA